MRFAAHTVLWGHSPSDFQRIFHVIRSAGFEGVELFQHSTKLGEPAKILDWLEDLELLGLCTGSIADRIAWLKKAAKAIPGFNPQSPYLFVDGWTDRQDRDGKTIEDYLVDGWKIALHPYSLKQNSSFSDTFAILDRYKERQNLLYLPDTAHAAIQKHDVSSSVKKYAGRLAAIHLKDWRPGFGRVSARYAIGFTELGRGELKFDSLLAALRGPQFERTWVVYVQDYAEGLREDSLKRSVDYLRDLGLRERTPWSPQRSLDSSNESPTQLDTPRDAQSDGVCATMVRQFAGGRLASADVGRLYLRLAQSLRFHLRLKAVAVWSCSEIDMVKTLQGVSREDEDPLNPEFKLSLIPEEYRPRLTLIGAPVTGQGPRQAEVEPDLPPSLKPVFTFKDFKCPLYRFPVRSRWNPFRTRIIIDLGFSSQESRDQFIKEKYLRSELAEAIIRSLDWHLESIMASAAADLNFRAARPTKLDEFGEDLRNIIQERMCCEDVVLFLTDDGGKRLLPFVSDHLIWAVQNEKYYENGDGQETTEAWEQLRPKFRSRDIPQLLSSKGKPPKSWSPGSEPALQRNLLMPIVDTSGESIGVVRCVNKLTANGLPCNFGDDDLLVLDHMMQHALPNLELRKAEQKETERNQIIAHELKGPAIAIIAASKILNKAILGNKSIESLLDPRDARQLIFLERYAETLSILVARAQYLAQGRALRPVPRLTTLMGQIIAPTIKLLRAELEERELNVNAMRYEGFYELPPLWVDPAMIQQVVFNLLDNAIKYRKSDKRTFKISVTPRDTGDWLELKFEDWGVGINEKLAPHIFDKGRRGEESHQRAFGMGMGLWIVKELLRLHECSIVLENRAEPTIFRVEIPRRLLSQEWQKGSSS